MRNAQPYIDAVWKFTGGTGVGIGAGIGLDHWLHTKPAFTLGLSMLGLVVGFIGMYRAIVNADRRGRRK
jgi:F0F1-type ATP synthase assembly protein I